jgi:hypothetical protein
MYRNLECKKRYRPRSVLTTVLFEPALEIKYLTFAVSVNAGDIRK